MKDDEIRGLVTEQNKLIRSRENTFMLAFSYWGHPEPKVSGSIPHNIVSGGREVSRGVL